MEDLDLPDLVVGAVQDARDLVETQVASLHADVSERLGNLGTAIKSWLIVVCVAIVTAMLLGLALAATLTDVVGLPWFASMWIVTATAIGAVVLLVLRAKAKGRKKTTAMTTKEGSGSWRTNANPNPATGPTMITSAPGAPPSSATT